MLKGKSLGVTDSTKKLSKAKYVEVDEEEVVNKNVNA